MAELNALNIISLTCPSCGGKLDISEQISQFACAYCGSEFQVQRGGGIVALIALSDQVHRIQKGVDRTAAELAIVRLKGEIADLEKKLESARVEFTPMAQTLQAAVDKYYRQQKRQTLNPWQRICHVLYEWTKQTSVDFTRLSAVELHRVYAWLERNNDLNLAANAMRTWMNFKGLERSLEKKKRQLEKCLQQVDYDLDAG